MPYDLAIFDFDGTLADSADWFFGSLNDAARRFGFRITTSDERETLRHCDSREILRRLDVPMWKLPLIARHMRTRAAEDIEAIRLFDGIEEALVALHARGTQLAIVSSNAEANVRHVLGAALAARIGFFGCGSSLFGKAAKLEKAIGNAAVTAARTICIGDEIRDIEAARSIGAATGAVLWGYAAPAALRARRPDIVIERVGDLAGL
ncbi:HAD hydrolase-like protein [Sphingomonas sp. AP4-R1]|uniref:HAD hydrolase-like protein n=1 Tax=Sphingomonas sp. AP4-R1 TaxID=2735134 RepID=UPI001493B41F|nr:HAD hydrolase-like protein [Sphingomonas sp. AP4-R1]QJU57966.1 HAD hydrolase-like protein [Sphingomonas sp. AP4-R1]